MTDWKSFLLSFAVLLCTINELFGANLPDVKLAQTPFFVDKIAVKPGGKLMLAPRLPNIQNLSPDEYELKLNFPEGISLNPMKIISYRGGTRVGPVSETIKELTENGKHRIELSYRPDFAELIDSMEFYICYNIKGKGPLYVPTIKFHGTFDWQIFRKEIQVPEDCDNIIPLLLKWASNSTYTGTLYFQSLTITEVDTGKKIFTFHPKESVVMKLKEGYAVNWLSNSKVKLEPDRKYIIECRAKGEGIDSVNNSLTKMIPYTRTFIFDVDSKIHLPEKLYWRIEGKNGKIYETGEVELLESRASIAPRIIDTSVWICETDLQKESSGIQQLFIEKFHEWGLNTVEPAMHIPDYGTDLNEKNLQIPIVQKAKKLGFRARTYMRFLYDGECHQRYLKANPQFTGINPRGEKITRAPVCPTHYLEKGNLWLSYCLDAISKSVSINNLDGVFIDFEINAAPYMKCVPGNAGLQADQPKQWRSPCMCERCREAFRASMGLVHLPNVEECCGDALYEKWIDFRCRQNIALWQLIAKTIKSVNPNATFSIYSGPPGNYSRQAYGVDWTMDAPYLDFAMLRDFCPFRTKLAESFNEVLQKGMPAGKNRPRTLYQLMVFPYDDSWKYGNHIYRSYIELPNIKNNIIRTVAVCGSYGWSFCGIWGMDDQLILPIKEANAVLAKYEDYFVKGKKIDNAVKVDSGDVEIATWQLNEKNITFIFNMKNQVQNVIISTSSEKKNAFDMKKYDCRIWEW